MAYHDTEWGVPVRDDRRLFEFLILEGAQAGLNWQSILRKREGYRRAFADFDPATVARYDAADVVRLLGDPGIVRNRLKIQSSIGNARAFLDVQREFGSFNRYVWEFASSTPRPRGFRSPADVPAQTPEAERLSKDLARRGFKFVGPTICYAFMQAVGMVNDHTTDCFRYGQVQTAG